MIPIILFLVIIAAMLLGVPIGISIGLGMLAIISIDPITNVRFIAQFMYSGLDTLPLLAIPCFMLAGAIMETGGLSRRMVAVANKMVGRFTGGLGLVTIVACLFFGAISGSGPATVVGIGAIMIPQMVKQGYDKVYATGLIAVSGALGIVIPPSIPMIIYGVATYTSVGDMFIAGIIPGVLVAVCLSVTNWLISRSRGYKGTGEKFNFREFMLAVWDAKWAMLMPVIILGGIYGGVFTPTEAAVIAVVYGIIVGAFIYREISWKKLLSMIDGNSSFVGAILMTFAPASALGSIFALLQITRALNNAVVASDLNLFTLLFLMNIFFIIIGMIMDTGSATIIFAPLVLTILVPFGLNPVHIGIILIINFCIGFVTPPVAINLFVASGISKLRVEQVANAAIPFLLATFAALQFVTYFPEISMFMVRLIRK